MENTQVLLPPLKHIPITIGNQQHSIHTDIDSTAISLFLAGLLGSHKGKDKSDFTLTSFMEYVKKDMPDKILLSGKQYNLFIKKINSYAETEKE